MTSTTQLSLGDKIARLSEAREARAAANAAAKAADEAYQDAKEQVLDALIDDGLEQTVACGLRVALDKAQYPNVKDWNAFHAFIIKNNALHMLHRRVTTEAWREWIATYGSAPPGTEPFEKPDLAVTAVRGAK
jgi:hypothetical protein